MTDPPTRFDFDAQGHGIVGVRPGEPHEDPIEAMNRALADLTEDEPRDGETVAPPDPPSE